MLWDVGGVRGELDGCHRASIGVSINITVGCSKVSKVCHLPSKRINGWMIFGAS